MSQTKYKDFETKSTGQGYAGGRGTGRLHLRVSVSVYTSRSVQSRAAWVKSVNLDTQ